MTPDPFIMTCPSEIDPFISTPRCQAAMPCNAILANLIEYREHSWSFQMSAPSLYTYAYPSNSCFYIHIHC
ncbi:hypothetical protein I7I48_06214 [Histoplasma ohiense]|nr:hypothetical protein I7I48_06214 [Histoplasma ohiense (nom. inval.)]